ncbi:MAG: T9SS type A sorting domain-containing protein [Flavobacteriales bacterium]|nr:T9SS type A sorting domain-containing protein [Flavobacteriales bacterium]
MGYLHNGQSLRIIIKPSSYDWPKVSAINIDTIAIANDSGLFISVDNGANWTQLKSSVENSVWLASKIGLQSSSPWSNPDLFSSLDGKLVYERKLNPQLKELRITEALNNGMYLCHLIGQDQSKNFKVIKR